MTKGTTIVTNNVFRSTRLFGNGSSNLVLFFLHLMTLRSYMTNHTTMVTSWNKLRSIQNLRLRPKRRFWLNNLSLHLLISFMWRNIHQYVLWGRTHNRHKIGYHSMIAIDIFILLNSSFNNQTLGMHLKRFNIIFNKVLLFLNQFVGFIEFSNQIIIFTK